ncbi:hypothetical protein RLV_2050 (plasmid) [Rhizobium leguminosarum bv. viciae]|nr:hypothetical protein RLV_2050 [Rhizobium leguminosarum bv. viciae]
MGPKLTIPVSTSEGDVTLSAMMQGFRSVGGLQRFISVFSAVRNLFVAPHQRHSALATHIHRIRAMAQWKAVTAAIA